MAYNATAYKLDSDGKVTSTEAVEVVNGLVIRACGLSCTGVDGTPAFDARWRAAFFSWVADVRLVLDGAEGYRNALRGLALPPAYLARLPAIA